MMQVREVVKFFRSGRRNGWIRCGVFDVYVRKGFHTVEGEVRSCFDLASISTELENQGKGEFKKLLPRMVHTARQLDFEVFFVESVINERLAQYLPKVGFKPIPNSMSTGIESFYLPLKDENKG